jgi:hypothetical protein
MEDKPVEQPEQPKPVLDTTRPLTQQVDKLLKAVPEKEDPKEEPKEEPKPEEVPEEDEPEEEPYKELAELPEWSKFVMDGLPTLQTLGHVGEGKDKIFNIKRYEDLPEGFEFATKRDEANFLAANAQQEVRANTLLESYNKQKQEREQQENQKKFQEQEVIDIQSDVRALQREKIMPEFQYKESDPKFNSDPAVKEANEIYELYQKTNQAYFDKYANTGRSYRISYRDAADKYYAHKARITPKEEPKPDNKEERNKVASKVSAPQTTAPDSRPKGIRSGTSMQDIIRMYNRGAI